METINVFFRIALLIITPVIFFHIIKYFSSKFDDYLKKTKSGRIIRLIIIPIVLTIYLYFLFMIIITIYSLRNL